MPLHPFSNFEMQKYYENEPKFNGAYSRNDLPKIKFGEYVINLDKYESIGTHWIARYGNAENVTHFDSFGVEHIPKEFRKFIGNKKFITSIYKIQEYGSTMCRYFCIRIIGFVLKSKSLLEHKNLISTNKYKKNDKKLLKYFQWWNSIAMFAINTENRKTTKYQIFCKKWGTYVAFSKSGHEHKEMFKEEE